MSRIVCCVLSLVILLSDVNTASALSLSDGISAESAVLISADTACVIYEKNANKRLSMASTTKIMTALLTLEEAERKNNPILEITKEMVAVEGSSMGLIPGDKIELAELAAGMLLASGNDAANAAAIYIAGSQVAFAKKMNRRANEIGMKSTNFVTASGLDDEEHYSTAFDMALLAREALKNEKFCELASSKTYKVKFASPKKEVDYRNHNKLLWLYDGCIGMKTGFTKKSGRCLISAAKRDGVTFIAVTLNAPDDWNDHMNMLDYGFSTLQDVLFDESSFFCQIPVAGAKKDFMTVHGINGGCLAVSSENSKNIQRKVILPSFLYAPIKEGDIVGEIRYFLGDTQIFTVPIISGENIKIKEKEKSGILSWLFR